MAKATVKKKKSILFVASECNPFIATGGLADVMGSLPKAIAENNEYDCRVVIPLYKDMDEEFRGKLEFVCNFNVPLAWRNLYCGLFKYEKNKVTYYFLDNEYYFKRTGIYGFYDDGERFAFFSKAALVMLGNIEFYPDVIHANDWQSALSVIYLKTLYQGQFGYDHIKAVFTIHNIEYQGKYGKEILDDLFGLDGFMDIVEYNGCINLMKGAIVCADKVTTVSPTYANEIQYDFYSHELTAITKMFAFKTMGILNGIDVKVHNPSLDKKIYKKYSVEEMEGKAICKLGLQRMLALPEKNDVPIISVISRLVGHKGIDLLKGIVHDLLRENIQLVILGKGELQYEEFFKSVQEMYPDKVRIIIAYNRELSSKIYSGSDIFLMPSKAEPCGLSQMIACRYGTIPVVRKTGGLADSIIPYNHDKENGFGFTFETYNAHEMLYVIKDAIFTFGNKEEWCKIVKKAMEVDFSWGKSAKVYEIIYSELIG